MRTITLSVGWVLLGCAAMVSAAPHGGQKQSQNPQSAADQAYKASAASLLPLTPQQVRQFRGRISNTRKALHAKKPASLHSESKILRLAPGSHLQTIRVAPGYVSSVVLLDETGQPWPITSVALGDATSFDVQHPKIKPKNLLTIAAKGRHRDSDLSITLKGQTTPIVLRLKTDADVASALVALRADDLGPNAKPQSAGPPARPTIGPTMMAFLDGVAPSGATRLATKGVQGRAIQAWLYHHHLYVRSHQPAIWPAWFAVAKGVGGVRVYQMANEPYLVLSENGQRDTIQLHPAAHR